LRSSGIRLVSRADIASGLNGLSGFAAVIFFVSDEILLGSFFVMISILLDGLDGILARKYGALHGRGPQIDSVADTISFCVAPATALYSAFYVKSDPNSFLSVLTIISSSAIVFTGIVRLGEFTDSGYALDYFSGMPTPAAALTVISSILFFKEMLPFPLAGPLIGIIVSGLMVTSIGYPKMKGSLELLSAFIILYMAISFLATFSRISCALSWSAPAVGLGASAIYAIAGPFYQRFRG